MRTPTKKELDEFNKASNEMDEVLANISAKISSGEYKIPTKLEISATTTECNGKKHNLILDMNTAEIRLSTRTST